MPQAGRADVVLTSGPDLVLWAGSLGIKRAPVRLLIDLPGLGPSEKAHWQQRIERLHNDCGCSAAATSLLAFLIAVAAYASVIGFDQPLWLTALAMLAAAVVILVVAKLFGYAWSRRKLRRKVADLVRVHSVRKSDEPS